MPKNLEEELKKKAQKMGLKGAAFDAYVYGTSQKNGMEEEIIYTKKTGCD